uniref:NS1 protein n=1 Tax=Mops bat parvovirus TaxID=3141925 RepID=A0AAU7E1I9_9VIRU
MECPICLENVIPSKNPPVIYYAAGLSPRIWNDYSTSFHPTTTLMTGTINRLNWIVGTMYFTITYNHITIPDSPENTNHYLQTPDLHWLQPLNNITQPWLIIEEKDHTNITHYHYIMQSHQRTDNAKRTILSKLNSTNELLLNVTCQKLKNMNSYFQYLWKNPQLVISNNETLINIYWSMKLADQTGEHELVTNAKSPKDFTHALTHLIPQYNIQTWEECLLQVPELTQKFLHLSNIQSLFQNTIEWCDNNSRREKTFYKDTILNTKTCSNANKRHIEKILMIQKIHITEFAYHILKWFLKLDNKKNTFILQGPGNTGKSVLARSLCNIFKRKGEILSNSNFAFQNIINKDICIWEEPIINDHISEKIKLIMEGTKTEVDIKMKAPKTLHPPPLIITTNHNIWHWCEQNEHTYKLRAHIYYLSDEIYFDNENICTITDNHRQSQPQSTTNEPSTSRTRNTTPEPSPSRNEQSNTSIEPTTNDNNDGTTISNTVEAVSPIKRQRLNYIQEKKNERNFNQLGRNVQPTDILVPHHCDWIEFLKANYNDLEDILY